MSWAYGVFDGREVGYSVIAKCDERGCKKKIDRGLDNACGGWPEENEKGCGLHFCSKHKNWAGQCKRCAKEKPQDIDAQENTHG